MTSPEVVQDQIKLISETFSNLLLPQEKKSFDIRPSVSFGDIEIFLGKRMHYIKSDHFQKVIAGGQVEDHIWNVLERLRGKKFAFSSQTLEYDLEKVQKEINTTLLDIIDSTITEKEEGELEEFIDLELIEAFGNERPYDAGHLRIINKILLQYLKNLLRKARKNG